jgi:hypothetical protein
VASSEPGLGACEPALPNLDLGPRTIKVTLGRAAGQNDEVVFPLIWNLED